MKPLALLAALALSACATTTDQCAGADKRRAIYVTTLTVADAAIASGAGTSAVLLGRQAAVTALAVLDARCPVRE